MSAVKPEWVEAGARAMFCEEQCDREQAADLEANWMGRLNDDDQAEYRLLTAAVLEAVAPMIRAAAAEEIAQAITGHDTTDEGWTFAPRATAAAIARKVGGA